MGNFGIASFGSPTNLFYDTGRIFTVGLAAGTSVSANAQAFSNNRGSNSGRQEFSSANGANTGAMANAVGSGGSNTAAGFDFENAECGRGLNCGTPPLAAPIGKLLQGVGALGGRVIDTIRRGRAAKALTQGRTVTRVEDITRSGSRLRNLRTDLTKTEFEQNLVNNGFTKSLSKDGKVAIFTKGSQSFRTRSFSRDTGEATAEFFSNGEPFSKIRLGGGL